MYLYYVRVFFVSCRLFFSMSIHVLVFFKNWHIFLTIYVILKYSYFRIVLFFYSYRVFYRILIIFYIVFVSYCIIVSCPKLLDLLEIINKFLIEKNKKKKWRWESNFMKTSHANKKWWKLKPKNFVCFLIKWEKQFCKSRKKLLKVRFLREKNWQKMRRILFIYYY